MVPCEMWGNTFELRASAPRNGVSPARESAEVARPRHGDFHCPRRRHPCRRHFSRRQRSDPVPRRESANRLRPAAVLGAARWRQRDGDQRALGVLHGLESGRRADCVRFLSAERRCPYRNHGPRWRRLRSNYRRPRHKRASLVVARWAEHRLRPLPQGSQRARLQHQAAGDGRRRHKQSTPANGLAGFRRRAQVLTRRRVDRLHAPANHQ